MKKVKSSIKDLVENTREIISENLILIIVVILVVIVVGGTATMYIHTLTTMELRPTFEEQLKMIVPQENTSIYTDPETQVQYIIHESDSGTTITPRLNRDGTLYTDDVNNP